MAFLFLSTILFNRFINILDDKERLLINKQFIRKLKLDNLLR